MDGFTGFKTAAAEELPDAAPVLDPFHVIRLVGPTTGYRAEQLVNDMARAAIRENA